MYCNCDFSFDPYFYMTILNIPQQYYNYLKNEDDDSMQQVYSDEYSKIYPHVSKIFESLTPKDLPVNRSLLEYLINSIIKDLDIEDQCDKTYIPSYHHGFSHEINSSILIRNIVTVVLVKEILYKDHIHSN